MNTNNNKTDTDAMNSAFFNAVERHVAGLYNGVIMVDDIHSLTTKHINEYKNIIDSVKSINKLIKTNNDTQ